MFTLAQINAAYAKVKSGADFPQLVQDLKALGVHHYTHSVGSHANVFYAADGQAVASEHFGPPAAPIAVAETPALERFKQHIAIHQQGGTTYPVLCVQAGESGVAQWVTDIEAMTCTYFDKAGRKMLVEPIPGAKP